MPNHHEAQAPIAADDASYGPARAPIPAGVAAFGPAGGIADGGGPILCTPFTLVERPGATIGATVGIAGSQVTMTYTAGPFMQAYIDAQETFQIDTNSVWAELTINSVAAEGDNITTFAGIGLGFAGFDGAILIIDDGNVAILQLSSVMTPGPVFLASALPISPATPITFQIGVDGDTELMYVDYEGNPGGPIAIPGPGVGGAHTGIANVALNLELLGITNVVPNNFVFTLNAGHSAPVIEPPVDYTTWCNFPAVTPDLPSFAGGNNPFFNNPDLNVVESNGSYTLTNLVASPGPYTQSFFIQSEWHYCAVAGAGLVAEITVNSVSDLDLVTPANISVSFGQGPFGGLQGVNILPGSLDGVTVDGGVGSVGGPLDPPLNANFAMNVGYTFQIRLDELGVMTYEDNLGNTGTIPGGTLFLDQPVLLYVVAQTPDTENGSIGFTVRTNPDNMIITPPAGYVNLAGTTEYYNAYRLFDFGSQGDVVIGAPLEGVWGRGVTLAKGSGIPEFTGSAGSAALTFIENYNGNLFEWQCNSRDAGMDNKIIRVGTNSVFSAQLEIGHTAGGFAGVDGSEGGGSQPADLTDDLWLMRTFEGFGDVFSRISLFNHIPFGPNDTIAMAIADAGEESLGNVKVQFILTFFNGGSPIQIVYDPVGNNDQIAGLTWSPIIEHKADNDTGVASSNYQLNGISADYLNTYPDDRGFTDIIEGLPVGTVNAPRQALLVPYTWRSEPLATVTVDGTQKILSITGATNPTEGFAHCPLNISKVVGGLRAYMVEMEITSAIATNGYYLEFRSPNSEEKIGIRYDAGELKLEMTADAAPPGGPIVPARYTITSTGGTYIPATGDKLALVVGTDAGDGSPGSGLKFAKGFVKRGANPIEESTVESFMFTISDQFLEHFLFIGHDAVPIASTTTIQARLKNADMSADMKAHITNWFSLNAPPGATLVDLEGVTIA